MPQEAWVLKCYSCNKFQVQLKKKAKKWQCKVCGAKQDLMTIFYQGSPSDCRVNVQKINTVEGEKQDKLLEQSSFPNQSCREYTSVSQSSQNCDDFLCGNDEDFDDEVMSELDQRCNEVEETYSQEIIQSQECEESCESDTLKCEQQYCENVNNVEINQKENIIHANLSDFKDDSCVSMDQKQEVKCNIFETNGDFDESLDF
ncbi:MRN complex-interacting protein [Copidosoma floridanum]|uniref:MRN complex-interacting protein n=1 Tax=Copidosoma floridanum TaxID=29053 RepID=UPI0006C9C3A0|nr:MRN complex-interacting protein [Copidosoma floridanum]